MAGLLDLIIKSLFGESTDSPQRTPGTATQSSPTRDQRLSSRHRNERIEMEVLMVAPRFARSGGILFDEANKDWLVIPNYPLPERWEERRCKLMIVFPNNYPESAPIGFYLNKKFQLKSGDHDAHFTGQAHYGAPDLQKNGWYWYCVRMETGSQGRWQPVADYRQPDNLWTFLNMVRESLTNDF